MIEITAFRWVPPFAQGLVKDLRVRWALEEAGLPYSIRLIGQDDQKSASYRQQQPFGQVPFFKDGDLELFESGSIVLHLAEKFDVLMPAGENERARTRTWIFAALNSIEPSLQNLATIDGFNSKEEWAKLRRPGVVSMIHGRLADLNKWMEGREYLENRFTAGDLMMTTVLRILQHTDILANDFPLLEAYKKRCEARPGFGRALNAQMKTYAAHEPTK